MFSCLVILYFLIVYSFVLRRLLIAIHAYLEKLIGPRIESVRAYSDLFPDNLSVEDGRQVALMRGEMELQNSIEFNRIHVNLWIIYG